MSKTHDQWQVFDLVEAFQLSQAVVALHDLGLLAALTTPCSANDLAARYKLDPGLLRGTLEYVVARTNLLRKSGRGYVATRHYSRASQFFIDLYVGAYGRNATQLPKLLRHPSHASMTVDRILHAQAFAGLDSSALGVLPDLIRQLNFSNLLDLGCGNGELLLELGRPDSDFRGWGIDANPAMLKLARSRARAARLGKRVRFIEGDCRNPGATIPAAVRSKIGSLTACNVANEMFKDGPKRTVKWLGDLRRLFPNRPLLILDYYGRLGQRKSATTERTRETLLHDFAQLISGQGIPPASAAQWRSIYAQAGCRLVHIIEDKSTTRFIHILRL